MKTKKNPAKKTIKITKEQESNDHGKLTLGQELTIDVKKADLLINRGIGKDVLTNRSAATPE